MKKIIPIFILLILSSCTSQVTVTSTATLPPPTETLVPTPTLHPKFIELQNFVASSERYILLPDGTIEEQTADGGRQSVPNLHVDQNGVINIIFNNEHVVIDQSQINFDDENGLTIEGYELENGEWVVASETITLGGVTLTIDENGVVSAMSVEGNYTDEQKAEKLAAVDPTNWGFETGEAQIVQEDGKLYITPTGEPETKIASWYYGTGEWEWDWEVMEGLAGGNPLFELAKTFEMNGTMPIAGEQKEARSDSAGVRIFAENVALKIPGSQWQQPITIHSSDDSGEAIISWLLADHDVDDPAEASSGEMEGVICFKTDSGALVSVKVVNLKFALRGWN
jgi:hypothetical protein